MIKLKNILLEISSLSKYLGSCVDVDNGSSTQICDIFSNASEMAAKIGNPDENDWGDSTVLTDMEFYKFIDKSIVPKKAIAGELSYHYVSHDTDGTVMKPKESGLFFIYNESQDIHYFFGR